MCETTASLSRNSLYFRMVVAQFWLLLSFVHCFNIDGHRRDLTCSPQSQGGVQGLSPPQGHSYWVLPKGPWGTFVRTWEFSNQKAKGRRQHSTQSPCKVPLKVWRHMGYGCRLCTGETRTIFFGLSANTVVPKHLLLYLSSSCCPKRFCETVGTTHTPSF